MVVVNLVLGWSLPPSTFCKDGFVDKSVKLSITIEGENKTFHKPIGEYGALKSPTINV